MRIIHRQCSARSCRRGTLLLFLVLSLLFAAVPARALDAYFTEEFNTTTYKDAAYTTANWNTGAGELQLFPFTPTLLGTLDTPDHANNVVVAGSRAYVADYNSGLQILNVSNPANPTSLGSYNTPGTAEGIAIWGTRAFVADGSTGLYILNVSNPSSPTLLGSYNTPGSAWSVAVSGTVAYVADGASGLLIFNVSNPASPTLLGSYNTPGNAWAVTIAGTRAYVADGTSGLLILNVANPASPNLLGSYDTPGEARAVSLNGTMAFVADAASGLQVIDVSNPNSPTLLGSYNTPGTSDDVAVDGPWAYLADEGSGLHVFNVSNPACPSLVFTYDTSGTAYGVAVAGTTAYVGDDTAGLRIIKVGTDSGPSLLANHDIPGVTGHIEVSGTLAFVSGYEEGVHIFDVSHPANPTLIRTYDTPGAAESVLLVGARAYVSDYAAGLAILDVSNPANPALLGTYDTPGQAWSAALSGNVAYVADEFTLQILSVANPASPTLLGVYDPPGGVAHVAVSGTVAYITVNPSQLRILDVSNPASPTMLGSYLTPGTATGLTVVGNIAYVPNAEAGLQIIDVSNPVNPALIGSCAMSGVALDVSISGNRAYVATREAGLQVVDISNPASPTIVGTYSPGGWVIRVAKAGPSVYLGKHIDGLAVVEVAQNRFDLTRTQARSLAFDNTPETIRRVRRSGEYSGSLTLDLSADGGATWQSAGGSWERLAPGSDLLWRGTLLPTSPTFDSAVPAVSRLDVEWLLDRAMIQSVADIPSDQGGWVRARFLRSALDFSDEPDLPIVNYGVWRRTEEGALLDGGDVPSAEPKLDLAAMDVFPLVSVGNRTFLRPNSPQATSFPTGNWELVASVPALQQDEYQVVVPTQSDSLPPDGQPTVLIVTAHTITPSTWYASEPDSGYSVDNIAPGVPSGFQAQPSGPQVDLAWQPSEAEDFQYFRIYRGSAPDFPTDPGGLVQETAGLSWSDTNPGEGTIYYKLTALDHAGNEGLPAMVTVTTSSGVGDPINHSAFVLRGMAPNPLHETSSIRFAVPPGGGPVRLEVFDIAGRAVRLLAEGVLPAGEHGIGWDGRDRDGRALPSGHYYCRMQAPGFSATEKLVLGR